MHRLPQGHRAQPAGYARRAGLAVRFAKCSGPPGLGMYMGNFCGFEEWQNGSLT